MKLYQFPFSPACQKVVAFAHEVGVPRKVAFERIVKKLAGLGAPDEAAVKAGIEDFAARASVLEQSLGTKEHVCGRLTIADFALAPYASLATDCGLDFEPYPKAKAWLGRMAARRAPASTDSATTGWGPSWRSRSSR